MTDLNALFLKVGDYCRREVITCYPFDRLKSATDAMNAPVITRLAIAGLDFVELGCLKAALEGVLSFQGNLARRYRLGQTM